MIDYFELLDQPRSASLDLAALKQKFHDVARSEHPDAGGANFQQLNTAYRTLLDPKARLAHLLELNGGTPAAITQPPEDLVELFFQTANALTASNNAIKDHLARLTDMRDTIIAGLRTVDPRDNRQLTEAHQRLAFLDRWIAQLTEKLV